MKNSIPIIYNGGCYGTFVEWCLNYFSGNINYLSFTESGSSHGYVSKEVLDFNKWKNYLQQDEDHPFVRIHPKTKEHEDIIDNLNIILKSVNRGILLHATNDLLLLVLNNKFEKIWAEGWLEHELSVNDSLSANLSNWEGKTLSSMQRWEIREFLSYYLFAQHEAEAGTTPILNYNNPKLLKINIKNLITDFENTIRNLLDYCSLCIVKFNFNEIYHKWYNIQQHTNKDKIVNLIIESLFNNVNYDWSDKKLTLVDESILQYYLRELYKLDLLCYNLNVFPTNTKELQQLLINV